MKEKENDLSDIELGITALRIRMQCLNYGLEPFPDEESKWLEEFSTEPGDITADISMYWYNIFSFVNAAPLHI